MIIGLAGLKQSGKDTVASYLIKERGFERKAFADPLKQSIAALFDIPFADVDKLKNDPSVTVCLIPTWIADESSGTPTAAIGSWMRQMSFREVLQRYGTEAHRDIFGQDFWIDITLPVQGYYPGRAIVVTDVRFKNEAKRIKDLGGVVWGIDRPGLVSEDTHASEVIDFRVDQLIVNDGTIDELFAKVEDLLSKVEDDVRWPNNLGEN